MAYHNDSFLFTGNEWNDAITHETALASLYAVVLQLSYGEVIKTINFIPTMYTDHF